MTGPHTEAAADCMTRSKRINREHPWRLSAKGVFYAPLYIFLLPG